MKSLKRVIALIIVLLISFSLFACGDNKDNTNNSKNSESSTGKQNSNMESTTKKSVTVIEAGTIQETELVNKNGVKIIAKSVSSTSTSVEIEFYLENSSSKDVSIETVTSAINGFVLETSMNRKVEAGTNITVKTAFLSEGIMRAGITVVNNLTFSFNIYDPGTWQPLFLTGLCDVHTSNAAAPAYDETGTVIYNKGGLRIIIQKKAYESSFWGNFIMLYIDNQTDKDYKIKEGAAKLNGQVFYPSIDAEVPAGLKGITIVDFSEYDMTDLGITSPESIELSVQVNNKKDNNEKFTTESGLLTIS